ncbi:hypothetical protein [Mucilaginibacter paludis]|uniref:Uncharacterized protein n=1 Tax=Mucilaginibacter paludis DSM 18603 TaxID=714943 RepID=H1YDP8_9SPHI|nr:hypothetical protein [Mucilaginibacter paludis]EHQ30737.1 hypothetical protein Mucpa_6687 [Mucilaginibacter paludis DSM 18603]
MKKIIATGLLIILILGTVFYFSLRYLSYIRALQIGFAPGISLFNQGEYSLAGKDIFRVEP